MKRILTSLLAVCLIISALAAFTACQHKCEYSTNWTNDDNDHWHVCNDSECTLVVDKGAHTWDEGKITAEATQEADGVKTFTCTVCQKTRTEAVVFTGLSREEWNGVVTADTFDNYTFTEKMTISYKGVSSEVTIMIFVTEDAMMMRTIALEETEEEMCPAEELENSKKEIYDSFADILDFDNFKYDAESKTYLATKEITLEMVNNIKSSDYVLRFENGKPAELSGTGEYDQDGMIMSVTYTLTFTDYGTTKIPNKTGNV